MNPSNPPGYGPDWASYQSCNAGQVLYSKIVLTMVSLYVYYLLQFRLSELEEQVFRQLWNALLTQTSLLVSEDFSVDDELDVRPSG